MKTYCLFVEDTEVYRGAISDCLHYMKEYLNYANDNKYHLVIMQPQGFDYPSLSTGMQTKMRSHLCYRERSNFIHDLESGFIK